MERMLGGTLEGFGDVVTKEDLDLSPLESLGPSRISPRKADSTINLTMSLGMISGVLYYIRVVSISLMHTST